MKKTTLIAGSLLLSTLMLSANIEGAKIYETNCKACHMLKPMMDKKKMMSMSMEERMAMKQKMMKTMKAPPMSKVSAKLKYDFKGDKAQIVAFIKDYIVNPDASKARCMPMALKKFGVMPPIGKSLKPEELDAVANWMVDNFDEKWDPKAMNMMCNSGMKGTGMMKCGAGKCGGGMGKDMMNQEKKAAPKPKADSDGMKCAAGKCGGKQ